MRYLVVDVETTSAKPGASVCEIGWIELDETGRIISQVESLIDPEQPISASASGIHGLTNEDVAHAPTIAEFFSRDDVPGCHGKRIQGPVTLIGHRVSFDRQFIEPWVDGEIRELCTLRYVRQMYPEMDDHKLPTCLYALGLPRGFGEAHRVMADVLVAYSLMAHIAERLGFSLPELAEHAQQPMRVLSLPFGKHRGEPIDQVPKSYLRWVLNNMDNLDNDFIFTIKSILGAQ